MIYHIAGMDILKEIIAVGSYAPEGLTNEGFIHCSTEDQVVDVANRYFPFHKYLILLKIDEEKLQTKVVYENLEGGTDLYPHIYSSISSDAIVGVAKLAIIKSGFIFPHIWYSLENSVTW